MSNSTVNGDRKAIVQNELDWHVKKAHTRFSLDAFLYNPPAFDAVVQPAIEFLRADFGELVLDMGSGEGKETSILASKGLRVISTDLSFTQLSRARELGKRVVPDGRVYFVQANAEELPFASGAFRIIYGKAVLHHLDLEISSKETMRLLKPEGRATFAEPLAQHPLFWLARRLTPKLRTRDERPLLISDLAHFSSKFNLLAFDVFFLFSPLAYVLRLIPKGEIAFRKAHSVLSRIDARLFSIFPSLRKFAWYGVIKVRK